MAQPARIIRDDRSSTGAYTNAEINIDLVVNARGRACLLHDKKFTATPVWVKYLTGQKKVKLIFDDGTEYVINYSMTDKLHKQLLNVTKLFLIRVEDGKPVEGYDTNLIKE